MTQKITVTRTEDHYTMQFGGSDDEYPVPTNAINQLDDDLTPQDVGESVTFRGDYGGHKHAKTFDINEVIATPGERDDTDDDEHQTDTDEFERIETIDGKPGVDTATIREGDVLELVSGEQDNIGVRYRVTDNDHLGGLGGDGGSLNVEAVTPDNESRSPRTKIVDNGTGPLFKPVEEADSDE